MRRHKYNARRTEVDGHGFPSRKEARRYGELVLMQKAGLIAGLELQPVFPLVVNGARVANYIGDFSYLDVETGQRVIEDVKSPATRTPIYKLKILILRALTGIVVKEV